MKKWLKAQYGCPVEFMVKFLGGKWKTVILAWLKEAPHRYGERRARLPGISDKVLTQRLKELEAAGLVSKTKEGKVSSLYPLTRRGESLRPAFTDLYQCGLGIARELGVGVGRTVRK